MFVRKLPAILVTAGLLVSLSACAGLPFSSTCTPLFPDGNNAQLVSADGTFAKDPKATFPTPLVASSTEVAEIDAGDGEVIGRGQIVDFQLTLLNGKTGEVLAASSYDPAQPVRRTVAEGSDALGQMIQCSRVGSRIVAVSPFGELLPGSDPAEAGLAATDAIVVVIDVERAFLAKANGVDQLPSAGFPSIVLAPSGQPGFTFASGSTPTDYSWAVLKQGNGAIVEDGDQAVIHFSGVVWGGSSPYYSSWDAGNPLTVTASSLDDDPAGLPSGWAKALIGQKVGSQVIVIIPPSEGYPTGSAPTGVVDGDTLVIVFDILGIQ